MTLVRDLHHLKQQIRHHKTVLAGTTIDTLAKIKTKQIKDLQAEHDALVKQIESSLGS